MPEYVCVSSSTAKRANSSPPSAEPSPILRQWFPSRGIDWMGCRPYGSLRNYDETFDRSGNPRIGGRDPFMIPNWLRPFAPLENVLRLAAVAVLVAGLASSILIWRAQDRIERENGGAQAADADIIPSPLDDRRQMRDLELYGGKGSVLMEEAKQLLHGKPLAKTIAVASVITAAGLFLVTVRQTD